MPLPPCPRCGGRMRQMPAFDGFLPYYRCRRRRCRAGAGPSLAWLWWLLWCAVRGRVPEEEEAVQAGIERPQR